MPVTCKLPPIDNKDVVYEEFNLTQGIKVWRVSVAIVYILKGEGEGTITWLILKAFLYWTKPSHNLKQNFESDDPHE